MGRFVSIACLAVAFLSASVASGFAADPPFADFSESIVLLSSANDQISGGSLIDETLKELRRRSATFEEMLRTLAASHVLTLISPSVGTSSSLPSGLMGRTRFAVGASKTVAFVEVITPQDQLRIRREAIAHELAHVVEVACLGAIGSEKVLRERLRPQLTWSPNRDHDGGMETRFAVRAGEAVLHEAQKNSRGTSQLAQLVKREGLTACPTITPGPDLLLADPVI